MAELGNLTVLYCPPSLAVVNCENPRRKPVLHGAGPKWACRRGSGLNVAQGPLLLSKLRICRQRLNLASTQPHLLQLDYEQDSHSNAFAPVRR